MHTKRVHNPLAGNLKMILLRLIPLIILTAAQALTCLTLLGGHTTELIYLPSITKYAIWTTLPYAVMVIIWRLKVYNHSLFLPLTVTSLALTTLTLLTVYMIFEPITSFSLPLTATTLFFTPEDLLYVLPLAQFFLVSLLVIWISFHPLLRRSYPPSIHKSSYPYPRHRT